VRLNLVPKEGLEPS